MNIKKKLVMGAMSATLGLALVGGGTYAAFNDVETAHAGVAAGTLDLVLDGYNKPATFNVSDLKPGDKMTREIKMSNAGTLAIKNVLMQAEVTDFSDGGTSADPDVAAATDTDQLDYLDQFWVTLAKTGIEGTVEPIVNTGDHFTLKDLVLASQGDATAAGNINDAINPIYWEDDALNVASTANNVYQGIPVDPSDFDVLQIKIEFHNVDDKNDAGYQKQNVYQGDSADVKFVFTANQWEGSDLGDADGYIQSNEQAQ